MKPAHFHPKHPKSITNLRKNNSSVDIRFVAKTSDIGNFSQNTTSDVKTSEVATLLLDYYCTIELTASHQCRVFLEHRQCSLLHH